MAIPKIEQRKELTKEELSMPRCDIEELKGQIEQLKEENQQLKELLKQWVHFYPIVLYEHEDTLKTKDIVELYDETREVLK